ncbi:Opaque-specific ABC transporter CDR3 [Frankliniella fusca]|uniref:Opaque-specific ABC transporter CDR3 n=1 Tax=Frankliniella fusca TaxID=407009 RepID=A0AAE1L5N2_9NEOP|nr:Opaque-specific ABC transporter CDR3 [Frankliniella fusca]
MLPLKLTKYVFLFAQKISYMIVLGTFLNMFLVTILEVCLCQKLCEIVKIVCGKFHKLILIFMIQSQAMPQSYLIYILLSCSHLFLCRQPLFSKKCFIFVFTSDCFAFITLKCSSFFFSL